MTSLAGKKLMGSCFFTCDLFHFNPTVNLLSFDERYLWAKLQPQKKNLREEILLFTFIFFSPWPFLVFCEQYKRQFCDWTREEGWIYDRIPSLCETQLFSIYRTSFILFAFCEWTRRKKRRVNDRIPLQRESCKSYMTACSNQQKCHQRPSSPEVW